MEAGREAAVDDHDDASKSPGSAEPAAMPEDDFDADAEMARWVADIEAGRERIPEEWELDGSAVSLSLGDACDWTRRCWRPCSAPTASAARRSARPSGRTRRPTRCARPGPGGPDRAGSRRSRGAVRRRADRRAARGPAAGGPGRVPADAVNRGVRPPPHRRVRRREGPEGPARPARASSRRTSSRPSWCARRTTPTPASSAILPYRPAPRDAGRDGGRGHQRRPGRQRSRRGR